MQKTAVTNEELERLSVYELGDMDFREAVLLRYRAGETIWREGEQMEYLLFALSGKAKLCASAANGRALLLRDCPAPGVVGDMELMLDSALASATLVAGSEFVCIALPYARYAAPLKENLRFVRRIGRELAQRLLDCSQKTAATLLHSFEERLCSYLLQSAADGVFCQTLTEVAQLTGVSYRHLLRTLNRLCAEGILQKEKHAFRILKPAELERRAIDLPRGDR